MGTILNVQILRSGQIVGQYQFDGDTQRTIKIGRLSSAQLKLEDPKVSRIHAVIELSGGDPSLIDMGSTVGTRVNGSRVHKVALAHGDQVTLGDTTLAIGLGSPAIAAPEAMRSGLPVAAPNDPTQPGFPQPNVAPLGTMPAVAPASAGSLQQQVGAPPPAVPGGMAPPPQQTVPAAGGQVESPPSPVAPHFDAGLGGTPGRRITQERLRSAAVESRPHPALPSEEQLTAENRVLEMRVYWGEVLLAMHHFVKPKRITIGETKGTTVFISSEGLPIEAFPLIRYLDESYVLTFCTDMEGEVEIGGEMRSLERCRGSSWARRDEDLEQSYQVALPQDGRSIVHWGGATFALRFVPPPVAVQASRMDGLDLQYITTLAASFFLHAMLLVTLLVYPYDAESLRVDLFDKPDRFASLILEAPKKTKSTQDILKKIKKSVEEKKKKLEPEEEKKVLKVASKIPKNVKPQKTQEQRKAEVTKRFSKLFSGGGAGGGSLLGGGGGGSLAGTLSNVIGTAGAGSASAAMAGLGIRGSGPVTGGGMGTSRGIAGIGTAGRLGGGGLAYGSGVNIGKRKDRGIISLSTPVVMGALPPEVIKKIINQNKAQVRYCYEIELQRNKNLEGRVMMSWIIAASGAVSKVSVKDSTMSSRPVEDCLSRKIKTWKFPPPAGGGIVEVNYPFVFKAS